MSILGELKDYCIKIYGVICKFIDNIIKKIKLLFANYVKRIKKELENSNWKVRYLNLSKKYDERGEIINKLNRALDTDENLNTIRELEKQLYRYKTTADNLKTDNLELIEEIKKLHIIVDAKEKAIKKYKSKKRKHNNECKTSE